MRQYSSPDLRRWTDDGVLAEPGPGGPDPVAAGSVWECPQLFQLDGSWVLLVSVWNEVPGGVGRLGRGLSVEEVAVG